MQTGHKLCAFVQPSRLGVRVCRFSPDASMILTAGDDESAHLWDIASRTLIRSYGGFDATVFAADFTPSGDHLVMADASGTVQLWDAQAANPSKYLYLVEEAHDLGVNSLAVAPNDVLATAGTDNLVKVWSVVTGSRNAIDLKRTFSDHESAVMCVRFSLDGQLLASTGGDKYVVLCCVQTLRTLQKFAYHSSYVGCCAFYRSDLLATGSNDRSVAVWTLNTAASESVEVQGHTRELSHLTMVSELEEVSLLRSIKDAHLSDVNGIEFLGDEIVTVSSDKTLKVWGTSEHVPYAKVTKILPVKYPYYTTHCLQGQFVACSLGGYVSLWKEDMEPVVEEFKVSSNAIRSCQLSPDGNAVLLSGDNDCANVWRVVGQSLEKVGYNMQHDATVFMSCFASKPCDLIATGCNDGYIKLWQFGETESKLKSSVQDAHDLGVTCGDCDVSSSDCKFFFYFESLLRFPIISSFRVFDAFSSNFFFQVFASFSRNIIFSSLCCVFP